MQDLLGTIHSSGLSMELKDTGGIWKCFLHYRTDRGCSGTSASATANSPQEALQAALQEINHQYMFWVKRNKRWIEAGYCQLWTEQSWPNGWKVYGFQIDVAPPFHHLFVAGRNYDCIHKPCQTVNTFLRGPFLCSERRTWRGDKVVELFGNTDNLIKVTGEQKEQLISG